jgi:hypothetical protein
LVVGWLVGWLVVDNPDKCKRLGRNQFI